MKTIEQKRQFVERRANGESYSKIAGALKISKSTCSSWEREMQAEIALAKQEALNELYSEYGMQKAARIRRLGESLKKIDDAIERVDLAEMPPEKLLGLKLKYEEALRAEYTGAEDALPIGGERASKDTVFYLYSALFERVRNGETSIEQAKIEMATIKSMRQAYNVATSNDLGESLFAREIDDRVDLYDQIEDREADDRLTELQAEEAREETKRGLKTSEAPLSISSDIAQTALRQQMKNLVDRGDVDGLAEFLSTYLEDQSDDPEDEEDSNE